MILEDKTQNKIICLYVNIYGDILYYKGINDSAYINELEENGIDVVMDKNSFLKLSMKGHLSVFITSKIKGYKNGIMASFRNGISKRIEIFLFSDKMLFSNEILSGLERASELFNKSEENKEDIYVYSQISEAYRSLSEIYKGNTCAIKTHIAEDDTAMLEPNLSKIIIMSILYILQTINANGKIDISAENTDYGKKIIFASDCYCVKSINGIYDFCNEYPYLSATSVLLRSLCNDKGVELSISCVNGHINIFAVFPKAEVKEFSVFNPVTEETLTEFFWIFAEIFNNAQ